MIESTWIHRRPERFNPQMCSWEFMAWSKKIDDVDSDIPDSVKSHRSICDRGVRPSCVLLRMDLIILSAVAAANMTIMMMAHCGETDMVLSNFNVSFRCSIIFYRN